MTSHDDRQAGSVDELLRRGLVEVPDGFSDKVMARIALGECAPSSSQTRSRAAKRWRASAVSQWLALAAAAAIGAGEVAGFAFGIWAAVAAG